MSLISINSTSCLQTKRMLLEMEGSLVQEQGNRGCDAFSRSDVKKLVRTVGIATWTQHAGDNKLCMREHVT